MKNIKNILVPTIVLSVIAALIALLLAITYNLTGIANIGTGLSDEELSKYADVLPNCKKLSFVEYKSNEENLLGIYQDENKKNIALHVKTAGYAGKSNPIEALIGFNDDGSISSVKIIACPETPGLGTKIQDEEYLKNFEGVSDSTADVDTITGATISSSALKNGVDFAIKQYNIVKEEVK